MMLTTERLVLRPWQEEDAESLYRYACNGQVGPAAGWKPHESVEESRRIIRTVLSQPDTLAVLLRERPEETIGSVGVFPTDAPDAAGEPEIGYWIGRPFWGQGLIPEAVRELLRWCFAERGAARVWCGHSPGNDKSRRVIEKCGFTYVCDGPSVLWPDGQERPTCYYAIAREGEFRVPFQAADSEFVEKRSRFISHLLPVESEEDARAFIAQIKKQYYDARHNCWCYLIGENVVRYSDDGEPQGTAGQPMLNVFQRENVTNVVCVVTRYFGGILLGAGGLTRAYSKGARDALCAAGYAVMGRWAVADIPCSYALFERVRLEAAAQGGTVDDTQYGADIHLTVSLPEERVETLQERLTELSAGGVRLAVLSAEFRPGPRQEL